MKKMRLIVYSVMLTFLLNACGSAVEKTGEDDDIVVITDESWRNNMDIVESMEHSNTTDSKEDMPITVEGTDTFSSTESVETRDSITAEKTSGMKIKTMIVRSTTAPQDAKETSVTTATQPLYATTQTVPTVTQLDSNNNKTRSSSTTEEQDMTAPDFYEVIGGNGRKQETTTTTSVGGTSEEELQPPNLREIDWGTGEVPTAPSIDPGIVTYTDANQTDTTADTPTVTVVKNVSSVVDVCDLPKSVQDAVKKTKANYPNANVAVGLFDLENLTGYVYNPTQQISAGCSIKAAFSLYVVVSCEEQNIDITTERIVIKKSDYHGGSGVILQKLVKGQNYERNTANLQATTSDSYLKYGDSLTIEDLLTVLLNESDNMAYEMLFDRFSMNGFREFLSDIGGQTLYKSTGINRDGYQMFGAPDVYDRLNEWYAIYQYINAGRRYSSTLKQKLSGTKYCYIAGWMNSNHNYLHKSGWIEGNNSCASDCALLDGRYLLVVLMSDSKEDISNANEIRRIGSAAEAYLSPGYFEFN